MASIKDLFGKKNSNKIITNSSVSDIGNPIESANFVKSKVAEIQRYVPNVDFTTASNFAIYGLAEKYYEDSINYIVNEYPYDGSRNERIDWELNGTYLDKYFLENTYPRTNGYVNIGEDYGSVVTIPGAGGFYEYSHEYIKFYGGPNQAEGYDSTKKISTYFGDSNVYATGSRQESNIAIDGTEGFSVEFWLKKDTWEAPPTESRSQVIVDLWNSSSATANRGRLTIWADRSAPNNFFVEVASGSSTSYFSTLGSNLPIVGDEWSHYALTFKNSGNDLQGKVYLNGTLNDTVVSTGKAIGKVTGSLYGYIGALTTATTILGQGGEGYGKLSGSLDDFRLWKAERTEKDIQQNWFTNVYGGTNTDYELKVSSSYKYDLSRNVDLGVYFKFNEGIIDTTSVNSQDAIVLDYAGRSSNGTWTGYSLGSRNTGSAIVLSNAAPSEFKDPIIYADHPQVISLKQEYENKGILHDAQNNSALYWSLPSWITADDQNKSNSSLKQLTQIMGSYFDSLQAEISSVPNIQDHTYLSGNVKAPSFSSRLLDGKGLISDEILSNATDLEYFASRSDKLNFEKKLEETKNLIYLNIYNNLTNIFKSKGTEKAFRNLIRCFGIDDNIVNLNLYGNNVDYSLLNNTNNSVVRKRYADFFHPDRFSATVYQLTSSDSNTRSFISSSAYVKFHGNTYECEAFFPPNPSPTATDTFSSDFLSSSLYGCHTSGSGDTWGSPDVSNFQVYSVRENLKRDEAYFVLTGTAGGFFPELTSSTFKDVYDNSKWNLSVRLYPSATFAGSVTGSGDQDYIVRFTGYQYTVDNLTNNFDVTGTISAANAQSFLEGNKRFFVGAHRTNFTGSVLQKSNAQISSLRVWIDHLNNRTLKAHAREALNFGTENPHKNAFLAQSGSELGQNIDQIPEMETLALNWDFDTVTGSNSSGNFVVQDFSSGSTDLTGRWGWMGNISQYQHTGYGYGFPASSTDVITRKFVNTLVQKQPEVIDSSNMISLIDDNENQIFTRDSRPIEYFFAFEKSMYNVLSQEILKIFATIVDFNNLIGEPVNRYRQDYKQLEKLRQLYFERIENEPDFDKFVEYYKWIDSSIGSMLQQLAPASANFYNGLNNLVESHVLERNKYWTKFPTLEMKQENPLEGVQGAGLMQYPPDGTAIHQNPDGSINKDKSTVWKEKRQNRTDADISSGDTDVDNARETIRQVINEFVSSSGDTFVVSRDSTSTTTTYKGNVYARRNFTKLNSLSIDGDIPVLKGGSNFSPSKRIDYTKDTLKFDSSVSLQITNDDFEGEPPRQILPTTKTKLNPKVTNSENVNGYQSAKSNIVAPFAFYSSSVINGYLPLSDDIIKKEINNYHDDSYGDLSDTPVQGPFTYHHVGGKQYRHIPLNTSSLDNTNNRAEAWNLDILGTDITLNTRAGNQPRATMLRDGTAKRPLNIANIEWGTSSANAGNYRFGYEVLQTSNRTLNNRYFIKSEGAIPANTSSLYVKNLFDYEIPRYDLTGANKNIFVERFNAPGGPETTAGGLNVFGAEYSVYNTINYRNLSVRNSLNDWSRDHTAQFGIKSGSSVRAEDYNTLANYHKVNRNARFDPLTSTPDQSILAIGDTSVLSNAYILLKTCGANLVIWFANASFNTPPVVSGLSTYRLVRVYVQGFNGEQTRDAIDSAIETELINLGLNECLERQKFGASPTFSIRFTNQCPSCCGPYITFKGFFNGGIINPDPYGFENIDGVCADQYDNLFVQHVIPQSECQYMWITSSIVASDECDQCCGIGFTYEDLYFPVGNTSKKARQLSFIPQSDFGSYYGLPITVGPGTPKAYGWGKLSANANIANNPFVPTDFAGINFNIYEPLSGSNNTLGWGFDTPLARTSDSQIISPTIPQYVNNSILGYAIPFFGSVAVGAAEDFNTAPTFNALMLHRNGPYQYPSWKQIRTGETPVARHHKRNNILSTLEKTKVIRLPSGDGEGIPAEYVSRRAGNFQNFYEPVVEFKYKPLETISNQLNSTLRHSYGNNLGLFSQRGFGSQSVGTYIGIGDTKRNIQAYDKLKQIQGAVNVLSYNEVVFPRSVNTGFAKSRRRLNYTEDALTRGYTNTDISLSPILNTGSNGIDRGPLERRTFWRDSYQDRNRRQGNDDYTNATGSQRPFLSSSLPNSQNHLDSFATSVYGLGTSPVHIASSSFSRVSSGGLPATYVYTFTGSLTDTAFVDMFTSADKPISPFLDFGELNSANYMTIASLYGTSWNSAETSPLSPSNLRALYPTASAYYYHYEMQKDNTNNSFTNSHATFGTYNPGILRWRTAEIAGKNPWFDSYEEYSKDISRYAKNYTILPEFKMSDNISYYVKNGGFKAKNNKFLELNGGNITASATTETSSINEGFFVEYSNSDFKQYFGNFSDDLGQPTSINLTCNGVKKLLPYNGFYPQQRTLQLASQFSQSVAPYISGLGWSAGRGTKADSKFSGSLAEQALLQPYYAPGIMFNTIKSGIAVDWAAHTSSANTLLSQSSSETLYPYEFTSYINSGSSYRIPFEAIMDPLGGNYIPVSSSTQANKLYLQNPSFHYSAYNSIRSGSVREPFVNIRDTERKNAQKLNSDYQLYKKASQNFFAEIPSFFLNNNTADGELKSITSDVLEKDVTLTSGSVYFMDVVLYKDEDLVMIKDYADGSRQLSDEVTSSAQPPAEPLFEGDSYRSYNGRYFGPPVRANVSGSYDISDALYGEYNSRWGINDNFITDPGFAPYTPPYFYGKSIATVRYVADAEDETRGGFSFSKMKNKCLREVDGSGIFYYNPELDQAFNKLGSQNPVNDGSGQIVNFRSPADEDRMNISSSMEFFGTIPVEEIRINKENNLTEKVSSFAAGSNRLVICPKMETPVLNFSANNDAEQVWTETGQTLPNSPLGSGTQFRGFITTGQGMWSGYGEIPTSSSINFGVEKTKIDPSRTNTVPTNELNSLVDILFNGQEKQEKVGELKEEKIISEAIVAIPFVQKSYGNRSKFASTVSIMDNKNFFRINKSVFNKVKKHYIENRTNPEKTLLEDGQSIQVMIDRMSKYVMPPQLDFLNDTKINPFVAYVFEFKAKLDQQDLADIWQGLMPKISINAEVVNETIDVDDYGLPSNQFSHKTGKNEFYGGKELPCDVRWMVFKVKRRANYEYASIRPDFNESTLTANDQVVNDGALLKNPYSYNWPYDYFSLVELAQLEVDDNFTLQPDTGSAGTPGGGTFPQFNFLGGGV